MVDDLVGWADDAVVFGVTRRPAAFATGGCFGRRGFDVGSVGRGRFRRVRGVLVEAGFEVREPNFEMADAGFEESDVRLNCRGQGVEDIRR